MEKNDLINIQNHIDYHFNNPDLLEQAFTRKSYAAENGGCDNEVLEFIGDKVLDFIVVKYLSDSYGWFAHEEEDYSAGDFDDYVNEHDEGELTRMKAHLVQKRNLADRIDLLGFAQYLIMGKGDTKSNRGEQESVKEDLFEAIIGAVALDSNWDIEKLERVVEAMLEPDSELEDDYFDNYIGMVQDWSLETEGELPLYHIEPYTTSYMYSGRGYYRGKNASTINSFLNFKFMCYLKLPGHEEVFLEFAETKYDARLGAAEAAYHFIEQHGLIRTIKDEIENPNYYDSIGQLEILARRGYFSIPAYQFKQNYDENGNPIWTCKCSIVEFDRKTTGRSSAKRDAKKQAAFAMLTYVLED